MGKVEIAFIHGFASAPSGNKATYFSSKLRDKGFVVHVPDMNGENFSDLTITGQLKIIERVLREAANSEFLLVGSSMGGLVSTLAANRFPAIRALVLLAPAFGLQKRWHERVGAEGMKQWREHGSKEVEHYAYERKMSLNYSFIEDAEQYDTTDLKVSVPTLLIHGTKDDVVPIAVSEHFQELNPHLVEFHRIDSDHGLLDCLPQLLTLTVAFMNIDGSAVTTV